ncbi:MAG: integration host factor subunit beta [Candidatus Marinimicrobia bacterium]|nr:integration host factor subunit beta [Candidatus Neomarinimicrobiota bacterium]
MKVKTYTKKDVAIEMAERHNLSLRNSHAVVDDFFDILRGYLLEDKPYIRIEIRNFGVFESKPTKAKPKARNPRTNEEIFVPAHKKTRFKAGKILKEHLRKPLK